MTTPAPVHSRLAPSAASRWSVCTASVGFIEEQRRLGVIPEEDSSEYADEGTLAHDLAAKVLDGTNRLVQSDNPDMLINVRAYVEFCRSKAGVSKFFVERRVPLFYYPDQRGTIDFLVLASDRIVVCDLKYGAGVGVYAEQNKQLASYAESAIREQEALEDVPDDFPVDLYIFQPRDRNDPEPVRHWSTTRGELRKFVEPIDQVAKEILRTDAKGGEFVPGPVQCRFCPAKGICKARATEGLSVVTDTPVDVVLSQPTIELAAPTALTRPQRQQVIKMRPVLEQWLAAVEEQEKTELLNGAAPLEFKLVEGKSNRKWVDEEKAIQLLVQAESIETIAPRSVISPAQAEKQFAKQRPVFWEKALKLIHKPAGAPSLVPVGDKRPALVLNPLAGMEDVDVI